MSMLDVVYMWYSKSDIAFAVFDLSFLNIYHIAPSMRILCAAIFRTDVASTFSNVYFTDAKFTFITTGMMHILFQIDCRSTWFWPSLHDRFFPMSTENYGSRDTKAYVITQPHQTEAGLSLTMCLHRQQIFFFFFFGGGSMAYFVQEI